MSGRGRGEEIQLCGAVCAPACLIAPALSFLESPFLSLFPSFLLPFTHTPLCHLSFALLPTFIFLLRLFFFIAMQDVVASVAAVAVDVAASAVAVAVAVVVSVVAVAVAAVALAAVAVAVAVAAVALAAVVVAVAVSLNSLLNPCLELITFLLWHRPWRWRWWLPWRCQGHH